MVSFSLRLLCHLLLLMNMIERLSSWCYSGLPSTSGQCHCKPMPLIDFLSKRSAKSNIFNYQVVIDAGSTGSRIHTFTFRRTFTGLVLEDADFKEIEPGLSSFLNNPEEGAYSLFVLLQRALAVVPKTEWDSTPISLRATAGLRLLPAVVAGEIMEEVRNTLVSSPFQTLTSDFISIMDGDDEGIFAWATLNFLTDNLDKHAQNTIGALDLGGGSTQIVFKPMSQETMMTSPRTHLSAIKILGTRHDLYSYSYLGLGLMSARQAVLEFNKVHDNKNAIGDNRIITASPCIPPAYKGTWTFNGKEITIHGNNSFSYENCLHYVKQIVGGVNKPVEIIDRDFYAFSYYYETAVKLGVVAPNIGGALSLKNYLISAKKVCSSESNAILTYSPFLCLDAVYVTTILRNGYGFREEQVFQVAKKINNVELSWALGAALHMHQDI